MELTKRKYKRAQVKEMLETCSSERDAVLTQQKARISELVEENKRLREELQKYQESELKTLSVLHSAEEKASEIEKSALKAYDAEVLTLKQFSKQWQAYFEYLQKTYPYYPAITDAIEIKRTIDGIFDGKKLKSKIKDLGKKISSAHGKTADKTFDPKSKIEDYVSATSDTGFNLDEVLNPGELELEDLCKELGLIEE